MIAKFGSAVRTTSIIAVITIILLEGVLRVLPARLQPKVMTYKRWTAPWAVRHETWGAWHAADARAVQESDCFRAEYNSNSWGMRDKSRDEKKKAYRVAFLGDSFLEGAGIQDSETLTRVLEDGIFQGRIEALNFGTQGYFGTVQEWLLYRGLVRRFKPDLVVLLFLNSSDLTDNSWWYWQKFGPEMKRPYLLKNSSTTFELFYPPSNTQQEAPAAVDSGWYSRTTSAAVRWSYALRALSSLRRRQGIRRTLETGGDLYDAYRVYNPRPQGPWVESWEATEEALRRLKREVEADGSRLAIVQIADPVQVDRDLAAALTRHKGYDLLYPNRRLAAFSSTLNIPYLSLYEPFIEYRDAHRLGYPYFSLGCDLHWGPLGQRLAAEELSKFLLRLEPKLEGLARLNETRQ